MKILSVNYDSETVIEDIHEIQVETVEGLTIRITEDPNKAVTLYVNPLRGRVEAHEISINDGQIYISRLRTQMPRDTST